LARDDNLAIFASLQCAFKAVQPQAGFWALGAVAAQAGRFQNRFYVFGVGKALFIGGRRQFAQVDLRGEDSAAAKHE
jgi:hypothetical protein